MLRSLKDILGYGLEATDGSIGKVDDFYIDDVSWAIRYLVADTARWLPGRLVLLSPVAIGEPDWAARKLPVAHTKEQVKSAPGIDADKPVSRQHEIELAKYYSWTYWWDELPHGRQFSQTPEKTAGRPSEAGGAAGTETEVADPSLRSVREIVGYDIEASDGGLGHVDDLITDTAAWIVRYAVIDTGKWLPGEKILIAPRWVDEIDWSAKTMSIDLSREMIKSCPRYDPSTPINRQYEEQLYDFYGRPAYW